MTLALKRDLLVVGGGRLVATVLALVTIRAITTFLTPAQYGELVLLVSVQMFCGLFLINPIGQHINLHTHQWWDDGTLLARLRTYKHYILAVALVGAAAFLLITKPDASGHVYYAAAAVFAMVAAGTWNSTFVPMLNMLGFREASLLWSTLTIVTGLASSIVLMQWFPTAAAWFAGQAVGMLVGAVGAYRVFLRHAATSDIVLSTASLPLVDRKTLTQYCLPLAVATGLMWLHLSGYRFVIEHYWGLAQLGFLAVGLQLAGQVWALAESLAMQFLYPLFFRRISHPAVEAEVCEAFSDLLNTLAPLYFVLAGLVVFCAPALLKLLVAPQFQGAVIFVVIGSGIEMFRVLGNLLSNAAHVNRDTKSLAMPYACGALASLTLIVVVATTKLEIHWASVALLIGGFIMCMVMWNRMRRQIRFRLDVVRWFFGILIMLGMASLVMVRPNLTGLVATVAMLAMAGVCAAVAMLGLLWKNPAALRLLDVKLRAVQAW